MHFSEENNFIRAIKEEADTFIKIQVERPWNLLVFWLDICSNTIED